MVDYMKQRVITAVVLLALLAVVVWQIYTPLFVIVIAFFSAVAANEIMKCAKVSNKFICAQALHLPFAFRFCKRSHSRAACFNATVGACD